MLYFLKIIKAKIAKFGTKKLNDREVAEHLRVKVHSGSQPDSDWESNILHLLESQKTSSCQIKKFFRILHFTSAAVGYTFT